MANLRPVLVEPLLQGVISRTSRRVKICALYFCVGLGLAAVLSWTVSPGATDEANIDMAVQNSKPSMALRSPQMLAKPTMRQLVQVERSLQQHPAEAQRLFKEESKRLAPELRAAERALVVRAEKGEEEGEEGGIDFGAALSTAIDLLYLPGRVGKGVIDFLSEAFGVSESTGSAVFVGLNMAFYFFLTFVIAIKLNPTFSIDQFLGDNAF